MSTNSTSTTRPKARAVRRRLAAFGVLAAAAAGTVTVAGPASASASGCTYGGYAVDRCVYVNGTGTYVNYVTGTIRYVTGQYLEIEVWGDGFYYRGHGSPNTPSDTTQVTLSIRRNLRAGSYVCTAARMPNGAQASPACVQIRA